MADSTLLAQLLASGDERFLSQVRESVDAPALAALAEPWLRDRRPSLRAALLAYVDEDCARPHHRGLVKRLFKLAEAAGDDELMAHFLCAFDRWTGRRLVVRTRWDFRTRQLVRRWALALNYRIPVTDPKARADVFSRRTRAYLTRRAFRYFRHLGFRDPARYRRALCGALVLYRDEQLRKPEHLLDAWGLVHALYGRSPVLQRKPSGVRLAEGKTLGQLEPAPIFEDAWWEGFDELLSLLEHARCRAVRGFALAMLRRHHQEELRALPVSRLRPLLRSDVEEVQALAAELLRTAPGLGSLPVAEWLDLLRIESLPVVTAVCELVKEHVSPQRLDLAQCVELACAPVAPVAEIGLAWAKAKPVGAGDLEALTRLGAARAPRVRAEAAEWVVSVFKQIADTPPQRVRDLLDSPFPDVREKALALMLADDRFRDAADLWIALAESPFDEVRAALVKHLQEREKLLAPDAVRHVWAATLLAVHRGGSAKRTVTRQLAERIAGRPGDADSLLPLLKVALRSICAPERRTALAALSQAAFRAPSLRASVERALPELKLLFAPEEAAR